MSRIPLSQELASGNQVLDTTKPIELCFETLVHVKS